MTEKNLTIVIVTFQSAKIIKFCLEKINLDRYEVIIADNNSSDNTIEIARQFLPEENIIQLKVNSGFARANNAALKNVKTNYALILNPDAFITEQNIEKIINVLEREQDIAIGGAIVHQCCLDENGNIKELESKFTKPPTSKKETSELYFTRFITGAAMFLRMDVFRKIGFFNENFFLYCEDNEICKRALGKGYKVALIKGAEFFHCGGHSSSDTKNHKFAWHRLGWSKAFYITTTRGVVMGKLAALRITFKYLLLMSRDYIKTRDFDKGYKYGAHGAFAYLVGKKAFDDNGNPHIPN